MKAQMFFSVIMPIYNVDKEYLYASFDSIKKQPYKNFELIIINDGADEQTTKAIEDYRFNDIDVSIYKQDNKGQYISRINGLKKAKGDYIVFFDSDDLLDADALFKLNRIATEHNPDVIMYSLPRFFKDESDAEKAVHFFNEGVVEKEEVIDQLLMLHSNNICSKCAKKELLSQDTDDIDTALRNGEDLGQATKLVLNSESFFYTKERIYLYRKNPNTRNYYDMNNIHNVNFPVPLYNELFVKNHIYINKFSIFRNAIIKSIVYNAFLICRLENRKTLLNELNNQEIVEIIKNSEGKSYSIYEILFGFLIRKKYLPIYFFAAIFKLIY